MAVAAAAVLLLKAAERLLIIYILVYCARPCARVLHNKPE